jgi:hypothetical protein
MARPREMAKVIQSVSCAAMHLSGTVASRAPINGVIVGAWCARGESCDNLVSYLHIYIHKYIPRILPTGIGECLHDSSLLRALPRSC